MFAVTNFWEKMSAEVEFKQGKNVADISKVLLHHQPSRVRKQSTDKISYRKLVCSI